MFTKIFKIFLQRLRNFVLGDFRSKRLSDLIVKKVLKYNKKKKCAAQPPTKSQKMFCYFWNSL